MAAIGFLGLGNMGGPMAKNLLAAGHALTVFDLVEAACAALAAEGAAIAASAAEAAAGADVIISMLPAGKHVAGTFLGEDGLLAKVSTDTLILDASTIDAATARQSARRLPSSVSISWIPLYRVVWQRPRPVRSPLCAVVVQVHSTGPSRFLKAWGAQKKSFTPDLPARVRWPRQPTICCWQCI